ncbi:hypothetical protein [Telluribacter sp.]|jgi:hypothetical protein|uniref:hypothetical protein n=1 Tax=Telluribacter sp. TaxID=1978767 RepID=UPI002E1336DE|nr:hypothetical protein [Telluribacter sp.]
MRYTVYIFLFAALTLVSCVETPDFDTTPTIAFNSIDKFTVPDPFSGPNARKDSVIITIDFEDGDGDLGVTAEERSDTTLLNSKYSGWGNYELKTLRLEKGSFVELPTAVTSKLFFPVLKRDGKPGPIKGKLDFSQIFFYSRFAQPTVLKFQVRVRDRSLRVSNIIETDTISVPLD